MSFVEIDTNDDELEFDYKGKLRLTHYLSNNTLGLETFGELSTGDIREMVVFAREYLEGLLENVYCFVKRDNIIGNKLMKLLKLRKMVDFKGYNIYIWSNR